MKIILSRKGFDSGSGGCPSPIFPDGRLQSLPIPDNDSQIEYGQISLNKSDAMGDIVEQLTRGKYSAQSTAHLDPDLEEDALPRKPGWNPVLGQAGAAQGHLRNNAVEAGDLFLFFGLFRPVIKNRNHWVFDKTQSARHVIWGWLQIGNIIQVTENTSYEQPWLAYHPHLASLSDPNNHLYVATKDLTFEGKATGSSGAGVITHTSELITLTEKNSPKPSIWTLPDWFFPSKERLAMTYHRKLDRWSKRNGKTRLQSTARGQEFILDADQYPEALNWVKEIVQS
ncbi:hypothetical protein BGP75_14330 [Motiliproteus sp. MSK22-1]|nr:hypothetical protein BGP75_14330 [Motiliproteus sp. MSK22-1]